MQTRTIAPIRKTSLLIAFSLVITAWLGALDLEYTAGIDGTATGTTQLSRLTTRVGISRFQPLSPAWSLYLGAGAGGSYELSADTGTRERLVPTFDTTAELGWRNAALTTVAGGTITSLEARPRVGITWSPSMDLALFASAQAAVPWAAADPRQFDGYVGATVGLGPAAIVTLTGGGTRRIFPADNGAVADTVFGEIAPVWYLRSGWALSPAVQVGHQIAPAFTDLGVRLGASGVGPGHTYLSTTAGLQWFDLTGAPANRLSLTAELTRPLSRGSIGTRAGATLDWSSATTDRTVGLLFDVILRWSPLQE